MKKSKQGDQQKKVKLKKEVFIKWEQPQVPLAYFKQKEKARKQLAKWNIKVPDDDIMIHIVDQMYDSDWLSEETMMAWEELQDTDKTWAKCQAFFEVAYIAQKCYTYMKEHSNESMNKSPRLNSTCTLMPSNTRSQRIE